MKGEERSAPGAGQQTGGEGEDRTRHQNPDAASIAGNPSTTDQKDLLDAAHGYLARGMTPILLGPRSKVPPGKHDANTITAENAARLISYGNLNLGLRLGPDHGGLVDFDLDWPEARRLGGLLLDRFARFGRECAPGSHYLLRGSDAVASKKYEVPELKGVDGLPDEHAVCVLEVRAKGHTMAPPSIHPNGEAVAWEQDSGLLEGTAKGIHQRAGLLAFLSVAARFYPAKGSRDDFCMALAGALLAAGLAPEEADRCIVAVAEAAGDEEAGKRRKAGQTASKMNEGMAATGIPRVVEMLGLPEVVAKRFRLWLGIAGREDGRPKVVYSVNRLHDTLDAAEDALITAGLPLYQMGGMLVQPVRLDASEDSEGVRRREGALVVRRVKDHRLREMMTRAANFVKQKSGSDGQVIEEPTAPPVEFATTYAARLGAGRLPVLRGIVECPTLRADGTVLSDEGYDRASGLILDSGGDTFGAVPDEPTREDAVAAVQALKDVISEFPFLDRASKSVALSAILTAMCRKSLRTAPLHGFTAPTMGTGKSLLADVVTMIVTGRAAAVMSQGTDNEDDRKRLLSILMQADPVVVIDNVSRPISGDALCSILTSETYEDRLLGGNEKVKVGTQTLFIANGNNLEFREDMSTRAILCSMDARVERPETRTFKLDLRTEVPRRRGELVAAALTVLRGFICAGRPGLTDLTPFGRFEDWSNLVRGALVWADEADPCGTREAVAVGDSAREELAALIDAWAKFYGTGKVVKASDVARDANPFERRPDAGEDADALAEAVRAACPRGVNARAVGKYLAKVKNRIALGRRIVMAPDEKAGATYWLEDAGDG